MVSIVIYNSKKIYEANLAHSDQYRNDYLDGLSKMIESLNQKSRDIRKDFMKDIAKEGKLEKYREIYTKMLGIDKIDTSACPPPEKKFVAADDLSNIYRLKIYVTKDIPFYAMLFIPHERKEKAPLVIMQHGGGGSPELCMDLIGENNYTNTGLRILQRGAVVIAPQLMIWNFQAVEHGRQSDVKYDRAETDNLLKRFGMSITGLEVAGIMKCIDYGCTLSEVNSNHIGMIGLSYGGYFTMHTMAADTRINVGLNCACFNDRDMYPWFGWTFQESAFTFQDAEVAALCAPRKLYISLGKEDKVFDWLSGEKEAERAKAYFKSMNCSDNLFVTVWDGGHKVKPTAEPIDYLFENI